MANDKTSKNDALPWTFAVTADDARAALEKPVSPPADARGLNRPPTEEERRARSEAMLSRQAEAAELVTALLAEGPLTPRSLQVLVERAANDSNSLMHLPPALGNRMALAVFTHRNLVEPGFEGEALWLVEFGVKEEDPGYGKVIAAIARSGEPRYCRHLAERGLILEERRLLTPRKGLDPLLDVLADPATPAQGRALVAFVLGLNRVPLVRAHVAPLLEDPSPWIRFLALAAFNRSGGLTPADVEAVLRPLDEDDEAVKSDPEDRPGRSAPGELKRALASAASPAALNLLEEAAREVMLSPLLDASEAMAVLAECFPERAVRLIDGLLRRWSPHERSRALRAASNLPLELAVPRLERACSDPVPDVAFLARHLLRERTMRPRTEPPESFLPAGILTAPASEKLQTRLLIAREPDHESRRKLRDLLVQEAMEGRAGAEVTALLATLLADENLLVGEPKIEGVNDPFARWMVMLRPQLGSSLDGALLSMARRFDAPVENGPFEALCALHRHGLLGEEALQGVRAVLMATLEEDWGSSSHATDYLAQVGAPVEGWEKLLALVVNDDRWAFRARQALAANPANPALDAGIAAALDSNLPWRVEEPLLYLGLERKVPRALERAREVLRSCTGPEEVERVQRLVPESVAAGAISAEEVLSELDHPESPRFALGLFLARQQKTWDARTSEALERAFIGPHLEAAGEVLWLFLIRNRTSLEDPRLPEILARVSEEDRRQAFVHLSHTGGERLRIIEPMLERYLQGEEDQAMKVVVNGLSGSEFGRALLKKTGRKQVGGRWR